MFSSRKVASVVAASLVLAALFTFAAPPQASAHGWVCGTSAVDEYCVTVYYRSCPSEGWCAYANYTAHKYCDGSICWGGVSEACNALQCNGYEVYYTSCFVQRTYQ